MTRRFAPGIAGALLVLSLTACTAAPTTTASPSPTAVPPSPAGAPSDSPAPPAATATVAPVDDATCENVFTDEEYASFEADNLTARTSSPHGPAMADLIDEGALHCHWAIPRTDIAVWFAQLPESEEAWSARKEELLATGWTEADDPLPGTLTAPEDYSATTWPSMVHADGVTYFVSYVAFLGSIAALS